MIQNLQKYFQNTREAMWQLYPTTTLSGANKNYLQCMQVSCNIQ